jgi:hypothetical protein
MAKKAKRGPVIWASFLMALAAAGASGYVVYYFHRELLDTWHGYVLVGAPLGAWLIFVLMIGALIPSAPEGAQEEPGEAAERPSSDGEAREEAEEASAASPETAPDEDLARRIAVVQLLGLLQREGRLIDFLQEDIEPYEDAQIGAAVREVHRGCRNALQEVLGLRPVLDAPEGSEVEIDEDFDPSRIRLVGNVQGSPPFKGVIRHCGWRYTRLELPRWTAKEETDVLAPAEVEIP